MRGLSAPSGSLIQAAMTRFGSFLKAQQGETKTSPPKSSSGFPLLFYCLRGKQSFGRLFASYGCAAAQPMPPHQPHPYERSRTQWRGMVLFIAVSRLSTGFQEGRAENPSKQLRNTAVSSAQPAGGALWTFLPIPSHVPLLAAWPQGQTAFYLCG